MTAPATLRGHPTLRDYDWRLKYTPESGDLVAGLYVPALRHAVRYDRLNRLLPGHRPGAGGTRLGGAGRQ